MESFRGEICNVARVRDTFYWWCMEDSSEPLPVRSPSFQSLPDPGRVRLLAAALRRIFAVQAETAYEMSLLRATNHRRSGCLPNLPPGLGLL
jgi:hypothetical protein